MNRLPLLLLLLLLLGIQGLAQNTSSPSKKPDWSAFRKDTLYNRATGSAYTSFKGPESIPPMDTAYLKADPAAVLWYVRQSDIISFFEPYLLKETIPPGDVKNSVYKQHMKKEALLLNQAKAGLQKWLSDTAWGWTKPRVREFIKKAGGMEGLKKCRWKMIPYYYLTFNSVLYKGEQNLTNFFTLDTSRTDYLLIRNQQAMGRVRISGGTVYISTIIQREAMDYNQVISAGKELILVNPELHKPSYRNRINQNDVWAYMENGHIVLQECEYGIHKEYTDNVEKKVLINRCGKRTAEAYLITSGNGPLTQQILTSYRDFVEMEHKAPLKPYYTGEKE